MKIIAVVSFFVLSLSATAQSKSYQSLYDAMAGEEDVLAVSLSGTLMRSLEMMLSEDVRPSEEVMKDIDHVRLIVAPRKKASSRLDVLKKELSADAFVKIHSAYNDRDLLNIYHRPDQETKNKYFVLVEKKEKVFAFEMEGAVTPVTIQKFSTPSGWTVVESNKF